MSERESQEAVTVDIPEPFAGLVRRVGWKGIAVLFGMSHLLNWSINDALGLLGLPPIFPETEDVAAEGDAGACGGVGVKVDGGIAYAQATALQNTAEHQAVLAKLDLIRAACQR